MKVKTYAKLLALPLLAGTLMVSAAVADSPTDSYRNPAGKQADTINRSATKSSTATKTTTETATQKQGISSAALTSPRLTTLNTLVQTAGLTDYLNNAPNITLLAPSDAAFAALPDNALEFLMAPQNRALLTSVLKNHVITQNLQATDVAGMDQIPTLEGQTLAVTGTGDKLQINGARVLQANMQAANGTIHVIDTVLMPPAVAARF